MTNDTRHLYDVTLIWDGNRGDGTHSYGAYGRDWRLCVDGKPELAGTADPAFRGAAEKHNPEDLFVGAIAACHMLFYLALCARQGVSVSAYEDAARGTMTLRPDGGGAFEELVLRPRVRLADARQAALAVQLHDTAHRQCFLANSCRFPIRHEAVITFEPGSEPCKT
jgi:organic hydroperoxide reductase OsmC/OhrA